MELSSIANLIDDHAPFRRLKELLAKPGATVVQLEGVAVAAKGMMLAKIRQETGRPIVLISYNGEQAERIAGDAVSFGISEADVAVLPQSAQTLLYTEGTPDYALIGRRINALRKIAAGEAQFIAGSAAAFLQRTIPMEILEARRRTVTVGETVEPEALEKELSAFGYERVETVEQPGQWTRRGGIVDVYSAPEDKPWRIDFFGDEVESIRSFDPATQRSNETLTTVEIIPAREMPLDDPDRVKKAIAKIRRDLAKAMDKLRTDDHEGLGEEHAINLEIRIEGDAINLAQHTYFDQVEVYFPLLYPENLCALDCLPSNVILVVDEPHQLKARWDATEEQMQEIATSRRARGEWLHDTVPIHCPYESLIKYAHGDHKVLLFSLLARPLTNLHVIEDIPFSIPTMESFHGTLQAMYDSLDSWQANGLRTVFITRQAERIRDMLNSHRIPAAPIARLKPGSKEAGVYVLDGTLVGGIRIPEARLMIVTDVDVFGAPSQPKHKRQKFNEGLRIASYLELREGDYIVHIHHGIGRYLGITKLKGTDGAERDYLLLEYHGGDRVYVQTDQVDRVQRYIGADSGNPQLHRLNTGEWQRATKAAKKQVQEMAAELIKLYAARHAARREAYPEDTPWQQEMEESFPYEETRDQLRAINDVKADLESERPMDRLVCGDVGYGKTEVAMRAAFKVAGSGRQVVVLCPTTILAQQHYNTFRTRLAPYPVKVAMLSRFVSKAEATATLAGLANGTVDIVIGTHKLLGKTIKFGNLGLLIVDEEQRFGVAHKERVKQLRKSVDVMTLTATPIPRTLHMALSGIRDLSLINDPPEGRVPIKTYIREYDDELVREVALRELDRGGQIYYVSNRIESIYHIAARLQKLCPNAKVGVGHGQMDEDELEEVMVGFYNGDYDILVCTTIVESGLDVSNVNTIVVEDADKLGLAQLYQLRGRVGRSERQGFAYLFYRKDKMLTEVAEKRLSALRDFSELGSGYKIALRDLEIRGAGNLLGKEQSGTVAAIGFDLYTQLLSQAINELKGEPVEMEFQLPPVSLPLDAHIPTKYIPSEAERILIYKKLTAIRKPDHVADVQAELEDRYGDPPRAVWNLLALLRLRLRCKEVGIGAINTEKTRIVFRFSGTHLPQDRIRLLARNFLQYDFQPDRVTIIIGDTPQKTLRNVEEMVEAIAKVLPDKDQEARVGVSTGLAPKKVVRRPRGY
ncbi:MAG TPA: transcription-repair coupling factor [Capsulimonadaceae bacterium]|jgi:transcription-repair coupling factor (superfamily II helicase)